MSIDLAALRQAVAAGILTELSASGWREADDPYDLFGLGDGKGRAQKSFAVGVPNNEARPDRQRSAVGVSSETDLRVRWAYELPALDRVAGYDAALQAGEALLAAVWTMADTSTFSLVFVSSEHPVNEDGWMLGELVFRALHRRPLT